MKRVIRSGSNNGVIKVEVVFDIELALDSSSEIAAATYKGIEVPEGDLPPADKNAIWNSQIYQNYNSFIEAVEDILESYDLDIYYKNKSEYESFYWSALAKDNEGNDLFDFTVRLRVSTHAAHRSKKSQENKKEEKAELKKLSNKKRVSPLPISVVINDQSEEFDSYLDAIEYVDEMVSNAVEIMKRRSK